MVGRTGRILLRVLLSLLIVANMALIFVLSSENGEKSNQTGNKVSGVLADHMVQDFEDKTPKEQARVLVRLQQPLRKLGHLLEFGALGTWILLLLLTWRGRAWLKYLISLGATFLYACTDECHQMLVAARGASFWDVLLDTCGALICCTIVLLFAIAFQKRKGRAASVCEPHTTK